jgi:hypothetical protein
MPHSEITKARNSSWRVVGIGLLMAVALLTWWKFTPPSAGALASASIAASFGNDAALLSNHVHPEELEKFGITSAEVEYIVKNIIRPRSTVFQQAELVGRPLQQGSRISYLYECRGRNGVFKTGMEVIETESGPKTFISMVALSALRAIEEEGKQSGGEVWRTKWNELAAELSAHKLTGYYDLTSGEVTPWPKM